MLFPCQSYFIKDMKITGPSLCIRVKKYSSESLKGMLPLLQTGQVWDWTVFVVQLISRVWLFATPWTVQLIRLLCLPPALRLSEWVRSLSRVLLFEASWTVAHQAPLSMGFSRQEDWSGLPFPSPGDLPNPGIEPRSPAFQADTLTSEPPSFFFLF